MKDMDLEQFAKYVDAHTIGEIKAAYPQLSDYLENTGLWNLPDDKTFAKAFEDIDPEDLMQVGIKDGNIASEILKFFADMDKLNSSAKSGGIDTITIIGGKNKFKQPEDVRLTIKKGEIISIVGPTGSGKSRLLADIECLANADTPTGRRVLINGAAPDEETRFDLDGRLVAQLSQNMNFIMDAGAEDFLTMHAKIRLSGCDDALITETVQRCLAMANELAGEHFSGGTKVTQLSGGQSRAQMIADTACISSSPIVLIDEIENAGIDRQKAVECLAQSDKIVIMSTHDPLLALSADKRIVIKNGGIAKIIATTPAEKSTIAAIRRLDNTLLTIRQRLRSGELIESI